MCKQKPLTGHPAQLPARTWWMNLHCLSPCITPGWKGQRAIKKKWGSPADCAPVGGRAWLLGPLAVSHSCSESSRFKARWALQPVHWGKKVQIQLSNIWRPAWRPMGFTEDMPFRPCRLPGQAVCWISLFGVGANSDIYFFRWKSGAGSLFPSC